MVVVKIWVLEKLDRKVGVNTMQAMYFHQQILKLYNTFNVTMSEYFKIDTLKTTNSNILLSSLPNLI